MNKIGVLQLKCLQLLLKVHQRAHFLKTKSKKALGLEQELAALTSECGMSEFKSAGSHLFSK